MEQAMFYAPQVRAILKHYSDRYEGCKDITAAIRPMSRCMSVMTIRVIIWRSMASLGAVQ